MRDDELRAIIAANHEAAIGESTSSRISDRRTYNLQRYRGEPYGDEQPGRSRVVSWDVFDVVESVTPSLLKIFASTDQIVECEPVSPEDEEGAKQATDYINYIFLKDNNGFNVLHTLFKDALLQINGFVKVFWEEKEVWTERRYAGITQEQLPLLLQGDDYIVTEQTERMEQLDDGTQFPVTDIKIKCRKVEKIARVMAVAPEDVGIAPGTLDLDECNYCYHRDRTKTVSDLIEMGYDEQLVRQAIGNGDADEGVETVNRAIFEEAFPGVERANVDDSMQPVTVIEHYIRIDFDGDGIAEYRKITTGGDDNYVILDNEELEENPLVTFTPIPLPHQTFGMALAETAIPIAEVKTTLQRQLLDNLYRQNSSRVVINQNKCNENTISDFLDDVPGSMIRVDGDNAIQALPVQQMGQEIFTAIEYEDGQLEQRSGVTRYNQGLDADSLNKTATGIQIISNAAQERTMLIARIAGEAVRRMFGKLLRLTIRHQDVPRVVRLRNKWVNVDPREWNLEMDISLSVGLGTGNKEQTLAHLMAIYKMQMETLPLGVVTPEHVAHTMEKVAENMGFKDVESYVMGEEQLQQVAEQKAQQPPQPSPEEMQMMMDAKKSEDEKQNQQQKMAFDAQNAEADRQHDMAKHQITVQSQEKIAAAKIQADMEHKKMAAEAASKPTTMIQLDAQGAMDSVAQSLQGLAIDQTQTNQAVMQSMAMMTQSMAFAVEAIAAAVEKLNAPRQVQIARDSSGKMAGAEVTIQ